jgi:hypothetical protein
MRVSTLAVLMLFAAAPPAAAQLPLLKDNNLVYAHHHLNVASIAGEEVLGGYGPSPFVLRSSRYFFLTYF